MGHLTLHVRNFNTSCAVNEEKTDCDRRRETRVLSESFPESKGKSSPAAAARADLWSRNATGAAHPPPPGPRPDERPRWD
ncbi:hypothetical protein EVAR_77688_1 [Eumeta japonica]|uniref:Uncharacterized protein n=1 Tax=Eumeta variegata TaxID=151549 RepID=A0A4C1SBN1_EUMVA|nr:hypothetical protein EVAR_77688_1 [Eumeta japonica]